MCQVYSYDGSLYSVYRRPSQWLSPGVSVFSRIVNLGQVSPPEKKELQRNKDKEEDENEKINETRDQPKPLR